MLKLFVSLSQYHNLSRHWTTKLHTPPTHITLRFLHTVYERLRSVSKGFSVGFFRMNICDCFESIYATLTLHVELLLNRRQKDLCRGFRIPQLHQHWSCKCSVCRNIWKLWHSALCIKKNWSHTLKLLRKFMYKCNFLLNSNGPFTWGEIKRPERESDH